MHLLQLISIKFRTVNVLTSADLRIIQNKSKIKFLTSIDSHALDDHSHLTTNMHHKSVTIKSFHATGLFRYPLQTSENQRFLMFSGVIERDQWHETG